MSILVPRVHEAVTQELGIFLRSSASRYTNGDITGHDLEVVAQLAIHFLHQAGALAAPADDPQVVTWDWKESVDTDDLDEAVRRASGNRVGIYSVDTRSDSYAIVVAAGDTSREEAAAIFHRRWDAES